MNHDAVVTRSWDAVVTSKFLNFILLLKFVDFVDEQHEVGEQNNCMYNFNVDIMRLILEIDAAQLQMTSLLVKNRIFSYKETNARICWHCNPRLVDRIEEIGVNDANIE